MHPDSLAEVIANLKRISPTVLSWLICSSDEDFDRNLEIALEEAADHIERNAKHLKPQSENGITAYLVARLNTPFVRATQETHSNGHVDITVELTAGGPPRKRLGEAKIYHSPGNHVAGLGQLLGRYITGREGRGFMVEYVKQPNIKKLARAIRDHMDGALPLQQCGPCGDHSIRWAFTSEHTHTSGEIMEVLHVNCNLNVP